MPTKKKNTKIDKTQIKNKKKIGRYTNIFNAIMYVVLVLIIILAGLKIWLITKQFEQTINTTTYQVIFLDNGESYFGKMKNIGFKYYELSDVYYLKYFPKLQEQANQNSESAQAAQDYELKLIRLGDNEFYKPENTMLINKEKIIHWENLQLESDVMDFILQNQ